MKVHHPKSEIKPFEDTRTASDAELLEGGADVAKDSPELPERLAPTAEQIERIKEERKRIENIMKSDLPQGADVAADAENIMRSKWESPDAAALDGRDSDIPVDLIPSLIESRRRSADEFMTTIEQWAYGHPGETGVLEILSLAHQRHTSLLEKCNRYSPQSSEVEQQAVVGEVIRLWNKLKDSADSLEEPERKK